MSDQIAFMYSGDPPRPLLKLTLTSPCGRSIERIGLLDSGADRSSLHVEDALRLGYAIDELEETTVVLADGMTTIPSFNAQKPLQATIEEAAPGFELYPSFHRRDECALWGRDFMATLWRVTFCEPEGWFHLAFVAPAGEAADSNASRLVAVAA